MPIHYTCDPDRNLVICTAEGQLTGNDMRDFDNRFRNDPAITPDLDQLIDITEARITGVTAADIREMVSLEPVLGPNSNRALVAKGELAYGLMRMFELYRGGSSGTIRFFDNRGEAERWLTACRIARERGIEAKKIEDSRSRD